MAKRKVLVEGKKTITMTNGYGRIRTYFSAESAARWWATWIIEIDIFENNRRDENGKKEAKLRRRALPIFQRYFNSSN